MTKSGIVRTVDGGEQWTKHVVPFQITGPLIFHPREENWILARGVLDGKVIIKKLVVSWKIHIFLLSFLCIAYKVLSLEN